MESKMKHTPGPWSVKDSEEGLLYRDLISYELGCQNMLASTYGVNCEQDARRIVACVNACKHYSTEDLEEVGEHLSGVFAYTRGRCAELIAERDQAVRALKSAGYTLADGAKEWKPPVGPSVSPMLDRIDELIAQRDELLEALVDCRENAGTPESVYRIAREAIAKCEVES